MFDLIAKTTKDPKKNCKHDKVNIMTPNNACPFTSFSKNDFSDETRVNSAEEAPINVDWAKNWCQYSQS